MAKNRNRDRGKQQNQSARERSTEDSRSSSMDERAEDAQSRISQSDSTPKSRQKRFGHN